jgi:hypothetical protein
MQVEFSHRSDLGISVGCHLSEDNTMYITAAFTNDGVRDRDGTRSINPTRVDQFSRSKARSVIVSRLLGAVRGKEGVRFVTKIEKTTEGSAKDFMSNFRHLFLDDYDHLYDTVEFDNDLQIKSRARIDDCWNYIKDVSENLAKGKDIV